MTHELRMMRPKQAAEYLGVACQTLAKWRVTGRGPRFRKLGRIVVYTPDDLRAFVDQEVCTSTSALTRCSPHA